ncbi:hypothetical protein Lpl7_1500 [Lacticaseibacillus paracasei subsp. tolerans Lpl7]|nr:hypothetical protein Lpl7_1500 [Lacticaseibacillus paracasei subsp. tolerans Lpl7]
MLFGNQIVFVWSKKASQRQPQPIHTPRLDEIVFLSLT